MPRMPRVPLPHSVVRYKGFRGFDGTNSDLSGQRMSDLLQNTGANGTGIVPSPFTVKNSKSGGTSSHPVNGGGTCQANRKGSSVRLKPACSLNSAPA